MVKQDVEVPETHVTGPLILRRLIFTVWEGEKRKKNAANIRRNKSKVELNQESKDNVDLEMVHPRLEEPTTTKVAELQFSSPPRQNSLKIRVEKLPLARQSTNQTGTPVVTPQIG